MALTVHIKAGRAGDGWWLHGGNQSSSEYCTRNSTKILIKSEFDLRSSFFCAKGGRQRLLAFYRRAAEKKCKTEKKSFLSLSFALRQICENSVGRSVGRSVSSVSVSDISECSQPPFFHSGSGRRRLWVCPPVKTLGATPEQEGRHWHTRTSHTRYSKKPKTIV